MVMVRNPCSVLLYMKSLWKVSFVCAYLLVSCKLCRVAVKTKKMFCIESSFSTDTKVNCKP